MHLDYTVGAVDHHLQSSYLSGRFNSLNDKCWMFGTGFTAPLVPFSFCSTGALHASKSPPPQPPSYERWYARWRSASASLNTEHTALSVVGREAACQISVPVFSISACLCFIRVCCHFTLYSFDVFGCAPHLLSELYIALMCPRNRPSYFDTLHQPIKYWWKEHVPHR